MRVRVGVGEKPEGWDLADHVLGHFSDEDSRLVREAVDDAIGAIVMMSQGDVDQAMNNYNAKKKV